MGNPKPSVAVEGEALRRMYAALNRNDISATVAEFDPDIEWTEPPHFPGGGTRRGLAAVEAHLAKARQSWADGSCDVERLLVAGDKIVVFLHVHVKLKHEKDWRQGNVTDVHSFRDGKILRVRTFDESEQALEWAGVEASAAN